MKFKLIGDVSAYIHFGYDFSKGAQDVVEPEFISKLVNHPNFEAVEAEKPKTLEDMTKKELEELGRKHGVELDRRLSKAKLIKQIQEVLNADDSATSETSAEEDTGSGPVGESDSSGE